MKMVHSEDLSRVSLQKGASITTGGRQVNASRHREDAVVHALPQRLPPAALAVPTQPAKPDALLVVAQLMKEGQQNQAQMMALVAQMVREVREQRVPAEPIQAWEFKVEYDDSYPVKRIKRIRATAIR